MQDFAVPPVESNRGVAARNPSRWFIPRPNRPNTPAWTAVPGDERVTELMRPVHRNALGNRSTHLAGTTIVEQAARAQPYLPGA